MSFFIFNYQAIHAYIRKDGQKIDFKFYFYKNLKNVLQVKFIVVFVDLSDAF